MVSGGTPLIGVIYLSLVVEADRRSVRPALPVPVYRTSTPGWTPEPEWAGLPPPSCEEALPSPATYSPTMCPVPWLSHPAPGAKVPPSKHAAFSVGSAGGSASATDAVMTVNAMTIAVMIEIVLLFPSLLLIGGAFLTWNGQLPSLTVISSATNP
jgi:hypothetical protein